MAQVALCGCIASQIPRAWECFITDQYPTIFNIANLYAQNRRYHEHDLADWFGYAYDRLHDGRRLGQFEGKSSLRTYLYRRGSGVVYRLFLDWLRTRREDIPGGDIVDNVKARDDPETQAYHRQQIERVHQATGRLTAVRRIAFLGASELAEIATLGAREWCLEIVDIFDNDRAGQEFLGFRVRPLDEIDDTKAERIRDTAFNSKEPMSRRYLPDGAQGDSRFLWIFDLPGREKQNMAEAEEDQVEEGAS